MNEEVKKEWVKALRSGKYKQSEGALHRAEEDGDSWCCLGVLCDIAVQKGVVSASDKEYGLIMYGTEENAASLPKEVMDWAELTGNGDVVVIEPVVIETEDHYSQPESLTQLNDSGYYDFNAIADVIEKEL